MTNVDVVEAGARLSEIIAQAAEGESIVITRDGKPVARISILERSRRPIDIETLRAVTDALPLQAEAAGEFLRKLRDADRY